MKIELRSQYPNKQIGFPGGLLELSWKVSGAASGAAQLAYEIQSALDADFTTALKSDQVKSSQSQFVKAPHVPELSREISFHRVRIETQSGWSEWSNTVVHETGLLNGSELIGVAIGDDSVAEDPATLLRTTFQVSKPVAQARLYASARGTFDVMINGAKAGDHLLAPGWTVYQHRILVETHDVTNYLVEGENAFGVLLTDGWWRGKLGWEERLNGYGDKTSFIGQIEIQYEDGSTEIIASDSNWKTATGGVRFASLYDGTTMDFTMAQPAWCKPGFDDSAWSPVQVRPLDKALLEPMTAPPVRVKQEFKMSFEQQADRVLLDASQNIAGWVRLKVDGKRGDKVVVRHAEVLGPNRTLHTVTLRTAKATDTYILGKDGVQELEPKHTFHGFQFADVVTEAKVLEATAIAITSDNQDRSTFESSHKLLNGFISNVKWSQRDNFVSIPTDCPQRDERMGWTGDAQAFIYAANTLVDGDAFMRSWLRDMALEQREDGNIGIVVPNIIEVHNGGKPHFFTTHATAGWGDAATVVPLALYDSYGDLEVLRTQLPTMRRWVDFFNSYRDETKLFPPIMQLGDWLDPDAPEDKPMNAKVSSQFMATAYVSHSAYLLSRAERLVGDPDKAEYYSGIHNEIKAAIWDTLAPAAMESQTGCSILLEFWLCPNDQREMVAAKLAEIVRSENGRIGTGFLGTPVILDALSRSGHINEAYLMLLREEPRSWLFPVKVGATTIWERWEAINPDGSIARGKMSDSNREDDENHSMISFNHYAYGAVLDWIHRNVAGLTPSAPGYKEVEIAPRPAEGIDWTKSAIETGYGKFSIDWKLDGNKLHAKVSVPFGVDAKLNLPISDGSTILVNGDVKHNGDVLEHGEYQIDLTHTQIAVPGRK